MFAGRKEVLKWTLHYGPVAHLVERCIRIAEVESSSLFGSTALIPQLAGSAVGAFTDQIGIMLHPIACFLLHELRARY